MISDINKFLEKPNIKYVDLKIEYRKERIIHGYTDNIEWVTYYYLIYDDISLAGDRVVTE